MDTEGQEPATQAADAGTPKPRRRKRGGFLKKLLLLCCSLVVALLLAELMVLLVAGEQPKFPRHVVEAPWGLRYNQPNKTYRHKSADMTAYFRINSQGMRADRDYSYAKPAGVKRIISLGDSFTIGYEVSNEQTFSSVIERELGAAGTQVEVLNCGVSGYSNAEQLLYLERELLKYDPDLVLVSFFGNDIDDNLRTGLFRLEDGQLVQTAERYVPAGGIGNFLNTNWFFNILSERSNAFCLAKERMSTLMKRRQIQAAERKMQQAAQHQAADAEPPAETTEAPPPPDAPAEPKQEYDKQLCAAIFERIYEICQERGIPLVIHSIPAGHGTVQIPMVEMFPSDYFNVNRPGLYYISAKAVLDPYVGKQQLYWHRSHVHWTPFSHDVMGKKLAELMMEHKLLTN